MKTGDYKQEREIQPLPQEKIRKIFLNLRADRLSTTIFFSSDSSRCADKRRNGLWRHKRSALVRLLRIENSGASAGPVVIEAVVDPFEAPMPPKITFEQATKFAESLMRGEPNRKDIVATVLADKVRELV